MQCVINKFILFSDPEEMSDTEVHKAIYKNIHLISITERNDSFNSAHGGELQLHTFSALLNVC